MQAGSNAVARGRDRACIWYGTWQVTRQSAQGPPVARRTRKAKAADVDLETRRGVAEKLRTTSPAPEQSGAAALPHHAVMVLCPEQKQRTSAPLLLEQWCSRPGRPDKCTAARRGRFVLALPLRLESYRIMWVFGAVARSSY